MRRLTDTMTIGQRVAFYRRRKGLSQEVLSGLVGRGTEWLRKIETGRADLERLSVIRCLADVLDITISDLVDSPATPHRLTGPDPMTVPAIRAALRDYRHLSPAMAGDLDTEPVPLPELDRALTAVWGRYQQSRYRSLAARLPTLIEESLAAARAADADQLPQAQRLTAYVHHVTTLFLTKLGETDLAWIAASHGLAAANHSGDPIAIGSLSRAAAHALAANGDYPQARDITAAAARYLEPLLAHPTPELLSVYGSLHLVSALAAARAHDRPDAQLHLQEAHDSAVRLGGDGNHVWTAFGPTNVTIHEVCVALELDDIERALYVGPSLNTANLPIERQVRHTIEVARTLLRRNRVDDALTALLEAERIGPDQVHYHALSRALIREILTRPRPPRLATDLAGRMGTHPH